MRRLRRREILRIATQDLLGLVEFPAVVEQISDLADVLLQDTLAFVKDEFDPRLDFTVLALGKLGGRELNYSSDVDLLYLCSDECDHGAAIRFARRFTRAVAEVTQEGQLFRVDLRLRPMGRSGEIIYPLKALQHYYSSWGDTFDRLALLKCRRCAGSSELAARFLSSIQGFVYRKYLDNAAVEEISWLKQSMDREQQSSPRSGQNVKLGQGGIREIEYFARAFSFSMPDRTSRCGPPRPWSSWTGLSRADTSCRPITVISAILIDGFARWNTACSWFTTSPARSCRRKEESLPVWREPASVGHTAMQFPASKKEWRIQPPSCIASSQVCSQAPPSRLSRRLR